MENVMKKPILNLMVIAGSCILMAGSASAQLEEENNINNNLNVNQCEDAKTRVHEQYIRDMADLDKTALRSCRYAVLRLNARPFGVCYKAGAPAIAGDVCKLDEQEKTLDIDMGI
jgi:hypothetical protein